MLEMKALLYFLILLSVGKSPADLKEFAQIRGEWEVVSVEIGGKKVPHDKWGTKIFIIAAAAGAKEQPINSIAQWGRLNTRRSPSVIESRAMSFKTEPVVEKNEGEDPSLPPFPELPGGTVIGIKSQSLFEVKGDRMKLLLTPIDNSIDKLPTKFETIPDDKGTLYELRRKPKMEKPVKTK